jgi:hypothetical protein
MTVSIEVAGRHLAAQYDGTNGAAIAAEFGATLNSDTGSTVTFTRSGDQFAVDSGQWFVWSDDGSTMQANGILSTAQREAAYAPLPEPPQLVTRTGTGNIAASTLGGPQNVTVTLDTPMAGTGYTPRVQLLGAPGLVGGHGLATTPWTVVGEDTVTVHLVSSALSAAVTGGVYVTADELV